MPNDYLEAEVTIIGGTVAVVDMLDHVSMAKDLVVALEGVMDSNPDTTSMSATYTNSGSHVEVKVTREGR